MANSGKEQMVCGGCTNAAMPEPVHREPAPMEYSGAYQGFVCTVPGCCGRISDLLLLSMDRATP